MKLPRRNFLHLAAGAAALPAISRFAWAQAYPSRPVRIIVGFPAGLGPDITARLIAQLLSERFGQSFIVDNRPGAGSNIGTEIVVRAPADGYTLLLMTASNAINATVYDHLNFDFIRDVAPVASVGVVPFLMVVNPSFPAQTISEFIAYAKAHPAKINMGSAGYGSAPHVFGELFKMMTGTDLVHNDRITDVREHDWHCAGCLQQWPYGRGARGQDDVRCERDQFRRVSANLGGIGRGPAGVDAHVAADGPAQ